MKNAKTLFAIIILLSFFLLVGTGSGENGESEDGVITLKVFHYLDRADNIAASNFMEITKAFAEKFPQINLEFDYLVNEPYHNKLQTMAVADELSDVMFLWPGKRTGHVTGSGKIKDLRPWLSGHESKFAPAAMVAQGSNGEIWELPEQVTATHVMFANTRLMDELGISFPKTFQELIDQGATIRNAGYIPIAMDNKDGWQMQSCLLSALVERTGGKAWLMDAVNGDASFSDPEFVDALEVIKTLQDENLFTPGINQADYGNALTDFVNGKAVYLIDGGWRTANLVGEMAEDDQRYVQLHVFPELPNEKGEKGATSTVAGTGFGMNANLTGAKADAAWEWIWFFSGPEGSKIKQAQGWLPAYTLPENPDAPLLNQRLAEFVAETPGGYVIDAVMGAESMGVLHPAIQKMMFGQLTALEAAEEFEAWVDANEETR